MQEIKKCMEMRDAAILKSLQTDEKGKFVDKCKLQQVEASKFESRFDFVQLKHSI